MFRRRVAGEGEEERSVGLALREGGAVRQRGRDERELEVAGLCLLRSKEVCSNDNSSARGGCLARGAGLRTVVEALARPVEGVPPGSSGRRLPSEYGAAMPGSAGARIPAGDW